MYGQVAVSALKEAQTRSRVACSPSVLGMLVREVAFEPRAACWYLGQECHQRGKSKCKGPVVCMDLVCIRTSKEGSVAEAS